LSRAVVIAVLVAVAVTAACSNDPFKKLPRPDGDATPTTATTAVAELSKVALAPVPGQTTTTIAMAPGGATLEGTVVGPDGAAGGAVVRVERLVGDGAARTDVPTAPDGTWRLPGIKGGRYRVRAFRVPDLAQARSEVFLLGGEDTRRLDLRVDAYTGLTITKAIAPNPPPVGMPSNLVVRAVRRTVDNDGVARTQPVVGVSVELFGQGSWSLSTPNPTTTDGSGNARFGLTCRQEGSNPLSVLVDGTDTVDLELPSCQRPAPSTTTSTTDPDDTTTSTTSDEETTTSTTSSTTSTTIDETEL